jgi:hypothetical protein
MFYWIYEIPALSIVALFAALFVGVCWLGIVLLRPLVRTCIHPQASLNEILGISCNISGSSMAYFSAC